MNDPNSQYDNKVSDTIVSVLGTIIRTAERIVVLFWDALRNAVVHAAPGMTGFASVAGPLLAPAGLVLLTSRSLQTYKQWTPGDAGTMAVALEVIGFALWTGLTQTIIAQGWKSTTWQWMLAVSVTLYELVVLGINAGLALYDSPDGTPDLLWIGILALMAVLPALASVGFAHHNVESKNALAEDRRKQEELAEKIRQERRADRQAAAELRLKYAADTKQEGLNDGKPFRGKR